MTPYAKKKAEIKKKQTFWGISALIFFLIGIALLHREWGWVFVVVFMIGAWVYSMTMYRNLYEIRCQACGKEAFERRLAPGNFKAHDICPKCGNDNRVEAEGMIEVK